MKKLVVIFLFVALGGAVLIGHLKLRDLEKELKAIRADEVQIIKILRGHDDLIVKHHLQLFPKVEKVENVEKSWWKFWR